MTNETVNNIVKSVCNAVMSIDDWSCSRSLVVEESEEEPLKKKTKVDCSVVTLPPNVNEVEKARMRSDDILRRTSCGGGRGIAGGRDSIEDARKEAIDAREAREGLAATAMIESGRSHRKVGRGKQQCKSCSTLPVTKAKEGLTTASTTPAVVRTEGSSHEKGGGGGNKPRIKSCGTAAAASPEKIVNNQSIATNKKVSRVVLSIGIAEF